MLTPLAPIPLSRLSEYTPDCGRGQTLTRGCRPRSDFEDKAALFAPGSPVRAAPELFATARDPAGQARIEMPRGAQSIDSPTPRNP